MNELEQLWEEAAPPDEPQFQDWYGRWSAVTGIDPDPDHPEHYYDYRSAFRAGVEPEQSEDGLYHWPSQFKTDDHPNRYVGNLDTKTGENLDELWEQATPLQQDIPVEAGAASMDPQVDSTLEAGEDGELSKIFAVIKGMGIEGIQGVGSLAMAAASFARQAERNLGKTDFASDAEKEYQRRVERARQHGHPEPERGDLDAQQAQLREYTFNAGKGWLEAAEGLQAFTAGLPESEAVYGDDRPVAQYLEQSLKGFSRFAPAMGVTAVVPSAGLPLTYAQIFGESYREKIKKGYDDQVAHDAAAIEAMISTPLEFGGNLFQLKLFKGAWNAFAKSTRLPQKVAAVLKNIVFGGLGEGIEEYLQQYPEELAEIYAKNPDASPEEIVKKAVEVYGTAEFQAKAGKAAAMGATGGAILGAVGAGAGMLRGNDLVNEQVDSIRRALEAGVMSPADLTSIVEGLDEGPLRAGLEKISVAGQTAGEQAEFAPAGEEDLQNLTTYLQKHLDEGTEVKVTAMGASEAAAGVQRVGQAFGRKVVFFDAEGAANSFNGLYDEGSDTIFVNSRAQNPYLTVLGHETLHALKTHAPDLYEKLSTVAEASEGAQAWLDSLNAGRADIGLEAFKMEEALAREELLADFAGSQFSSEAFWKEMHAQDPSLARKVAEIIDTLLRKIKEMMQRAGLAEPDQQLVKNLAETRAAMASVFSEFAERAEPAVREKTLLQKGVEAVGEAIGPSAAEARMRTAQSAQSEKPAPKTKPVEEITEEEWEAAERLAPEETPEKPAPEPAQPSAKTPREEFDELWQSLTPVQKKRLADIPGDDEIDYPSKIQMVRAELATKRQEKPEAERKDIAASVTTGERVTTLRGRIRAMGGINFLNFKGELKDMPSVKIALSRKNGEKIDLAEDILREEGWLAPDEKLLDVLRVPGAMRRGKIMGGGREKEDVFKTDEERRLQHEMDWEVEEPPAGDYVQMRARDLPEGKRLVILDGKTSRGWDVYQVVEKDAFGVVLQDGTTVNLGNNDLVEVMEPGKAAELKASVRRPGMPKGAILKIRIPNQAQSGGGVTGYLGADGRILIDGHWYGPKDEMYKGEDKKVVFPQLPEDVLAKLRASKSQDVDELYDAIWKIDKSIPYNGRADNLRYKNVPSEFRLMVRNLESDGVRSPSKKQIEKVLIDEDVNRYFKIELSYLHLDEAPRQLLSDEKSALQAWVDAGGALGRTALESLEKKYVFKASTRRGPGHVAIANQAAWISENRKRKLDEIDVEVMAIDADGKTYKIKEKAGSALTELERQKTFAERLLECLKS